MIIWSTVQWNLTNKVAHGTEQKWPKWRADHITRTETGVPPYIYYCYSNLFVLFIHVCILSRIPFV